MGNHSLALLVSDALAFTPEITDVRREALVGALRQVARDVVTDEDEARWCDRFLSIGCQITAPFNPETMEAWLESRPQGLTG